LFNDTDSSSTFWASVQDAAQDVILPVLQLIDIRLAIVIGLAMFMVAVSVDSSGHPAEAADLMNQSALVPVTIAPASQPSAPGGLYGDDRARLSTARRLHHGSLTSAIMTNNRLTDAHFFTDLPSEQ
jgi:hypothetical protein